MEYKLIDRKTVYDFDGFTTEYSWYKCLDSGENIFIFGDSDYYTPENSEPDYETSDDEVAREWFDSYEGFESMDLEEDVATATSGDVLEGEFSVDGDTFVDENGEKHPVNDGGEVVMDEIIDEGIIDKDRSVIVFDNNKAFLMDYNRLMEETTAKKTETEPERLVIDLD